MQVDAIVNTTNSEMMGYSYCIGADRAVNYNADINENYIRRCKK